MQRSDELFCANPRCVLHVSADDPNVTGQGEWATLANGYTFARVLVGDHCFCHACAEDPSHPPTIDELGG